LGTWKNSGGIQHDVKESVKKRRVATTDDEKGDGVPGELDSGVGWKRRSEKRRLPQRGGFFWWGKWRPKDSR